MPHGPRFLKLTAEAKAKIREVTATEARQLQQEGTLLLTSARPKNGPWNGPRAPCTSAREF